MASFTDPVPGGLAGRIVKLDVESFEVQSDTIDGGKLAVSVSFPPAYDPQGPALPVVYALDAQWHAGLYEKIHAGLNGPEGMHEVSPFVQVNIGYIDDGVDPLVTRNRDLLPPGEPYPEYMHDWLTEMFASDGAEENTAMVDQYVRWLNNPHADHFLAFLENELHPHIKERYNVNDDAGLFGFSYGALFAMYALTENSTLFTKFGAGSPGILIPNSTIFDRYRTFAADPANAGRERHLHITIGTGEIFSPSHLFRQLAIQTFQFIDVVADHPVPGVTLSAKIIEKEDHETGCIDAYRNFARVCYPSGVRNIEL